MKCPQCSLDLIEIKEDHSAFQTQNLGNNPYSAVVSGSGAIINIPNWTAGPLTSTGSGSWVPTNTQNTHTTYNCPNCSISITIDDDKKAKEKKSLLSVIEGLVEKKKHCNEIINDFNKRWGENLTIDKLEQLLVLK